MRRQIPLHKLRLDAAASDTTTRDRYRAVIRRLPARGYIDTLAALYFREFNWAYDALDRDVFDRQLAEWYEIPFSVLSTGAGPQALSPDLRAFPALVFQVIAVAMMVLGRGRQGRDGWCFRGLKDSLDPKPAADTAEAALESQ